MSLSNRLSEQWRETFAAKWLNTRSASDRKVIIALAWLVVAVMLWSLIWKPISDWQVTEHNRYENAASTLEYVENNRAKAKQIASSKRTGTGGKRQLIPTITKAADARGIQVTRLQPEASGSVSVVLTNQVFNDVYSWLVGLNQSNGVAVDFVSMNPGDSPGYVDAQIRLR